MSEDPTRRTERDTLNRGLQEEEDRLKDPERRPPHHGPESEASEPERHITTQEKADEDTAHLENPPQSEGPRERSNEGTDRT